MRDIRKQVALLSVGITEKVLRKDLSETDPQLELLRKLSDEIAAKGLDRNLRN